MIIYRAKMTIGIVDSSGRFLLLKKFDKNKEYSNVVLIKAVKCGQPGLNVTKPIIINRKKDI